MNKTYTGNIVESISEREAGDNKVENFESCHNYPSYLVTILVTPTTSINELDIDFWSLFCL